MGAIEFLCKKFSVPDGKTISETVSLPTCWGTIAELLEDFRDYKEPYEPYFGWCEVRGCTNEGSSGGSCWGETGYWTICFKHGMEFRDGKPQPEMKKTAIEREEYRKTQEDGFLMDWDKKPGRDE